MNWLDIVLVAAIAFVTWRAYVNGFIRELVSLSVAFLAIPIAGIFYGDMFPKVKPIVDNDNLARLVSFLAILIGVIVAGQVAAHLLKRTVAMLNLGALDHLAGGAFGFAKAVLIAQVVAVPDAKYGEVPAAFVQLRPGTTATADELIEHCQGRIASFKVPRLVRFVDDWPMSATKIQKYRLRELLAETPSVPQGR